MDSRTKKNIDSLHPRAQVWAKAFLSAIDEANVLPEGYSVRIISGNRTFAEQDALFAQGRSRRHDEMGRTLDVVTNARGGQSNHNFGIAFDIGIFNAKGDYLGSSDLYSVLGPIGEEVGLEWGGRWKSFKDTPHYQVKTGLSTAQLRALVLRGQSVPVPAYKGESPVTPRPDFVEVFDGEKKTLIDAYLEQGRVWVAIRPFVNRFGGEILEVSPTSFSVELHEEQVTMPGTIRKGVGFVKFADLNRVLDWGFSYEAGRLTIQTGEKA